MRRLPIHFVRQRFMAASEDQIAEIECRFGVRLPDDHRRFLLTRGSMSEFLPPANSYIQIGPITANNRELFQRETASRRRPTRRPTLVGCARYRGQIQEEFPMPP